jgi:hypothetical protein
MWSPQTTKTAPQGNPKPRIHWRKGTPTHGRKDPQTTNTWKPLNISKLATKGSPRPRMEGTSDHGRRKAGDSPAGTGNGTPNHGSQAYKPQAKGDPKPRIATSGTKGSEKVGRLSGEKKVPRQRGTQQGNHKPRMRSLRAPEAGPPFPNHPGTRSAAGASRAAGACAAAAGHCRAPAISRALRLACFVVPYPAEAVRSGRKAVPLPGLRPKAPRLPQDV